MGKHLSEDQWVGPKSEEGLRRNPTLPNADQLPGQKDLSRYTGFEKLLELWGFLPTGGGVTPSMVDRLPAVMILLGTLLCFILAFA
jgi:hypothetical protein